MRSTRVALCRYAGRRISGHVQMAILGISSDRWGSCSEVPKVVRMTKSPVRTARLSELSLAALRQYRLQLREEEDRVSYWRRLLQARLDMVAAGKAQSGPMSAQQIAAALGDGVARQHRIAMVATEVGAPLPELPKLAALWSHPLGELGGGAADATVVGGLVEAEAQLSTYRTSLHGLLDAATAELISRYKADPSSCLDVLPIPPASVPVDSEVSTSVATATSVSSLPRRH